mmetsp:Transcript_21543/g.31717  ORF Transcript_21543/g.31717 Transcript_21543/m.31717 type:complete len:214 (-) Transcript_21543:28-669(-)
MVRVRSVFSHRSNFLLSPPPFCFPFRFDSIANRNAVATSLNVKAAMEDTGKKHSSPPKTGLKAFPDFLDALVFFNFCFEAPPLLLTPPPRGLGIEIKDDLVLLEEGMALFCCANDNAEVDEKEQLVLNNADDDRFFPFITALIEGRSLPPPPPGIAIFPSAITSKGTRRSAAKRKIMFISMKDFPFLLFCTCSKQCPVGRQWRCLCCDRFMYL